MIIRKRQIILMTLLGMILIIAGCSSSDSPGNSSADPTDQPINNSVVSPDSNSSTIFGEITSIDSDQLTIALAKLPERQKMSNEGNALSPDGNQTPGQPPSSDGSTPPPSSSSEPPTSKPGAEGPPPRNDGNIAKIELIGENQVVTIAGDTIIEAERKGSFQNAEESADKLEAAELTIGMVVEITLKTDSSDTKNTASVIRVMSK